MPGARGRRIVPGTPADIRRRAAFARAKALGWRVYVGGRQPSSGTEAPTSPKGRRAGKVAKKTEGA